MEITDVRVRRICDEDKMKAIVSITMDGEFAVHDIKLIDGANGLFIAMPSKKLGKGEFRDIAHPLSSTTREKIKTAVFAEYNRVKEILESNPEMELSDVYKEE
ncbi:MAG: septation regulator SpoVG [Eubacteriales bacterium]|jgi:stage V sporulation protein G|uniref:Putative septation protein SpoVG n=1 Tax=Baileyella intestinalis TaxID=2606709 RepID=A0A6A8M7V1_9FIRM|nr:septation regulator SpoVG [Baileyella intestinalis]MCI7686598.1 septation regulator SpoVG [Clostridiales bacterium]MDD5874584.1 septation regulator SpoVG [Baileyella intestinalis]MDY2994230.1 septation regulator SpoVG [Baileyella intestinalis]MST69412.1 septation regulator SpoVG [Baileyella intestinalis]